MYVQEILSAASTILGHDDERLQEFCTVAEQEALSRLRKDVVPEDCGDVFITAAALLAVSLYQAIVSCNAAGVSYRAGEVSVTEVGADNYLSVSQSLRKQAEALLMPYVEDDSFSFVGVQG